MFFEHVESTLAIRHTRVGYCWLLVIADWLPIVSLNTHFFLTLAEHLCTEGLTATELPDPSGWAWAANYQHCPWTGGYCYFSFVMICFTTCQKDDVWDKYFTCLWPPSQCSMFLGKADSQRSTTCNTKRYKTKTCRVYNTMKYCILKHVAQYNAGHVLHWL